MRRSVLALAVVFAMTAVTALAAANPSLEIQSPKENETLNGNVLIIKFRTHDFKVVSLRNMVVPGTPSASASNNSEWSSSAPGLSGMAGRPSGNAPGSMSPSTATPAAPVTNGYSGGEPGTGSQTVPVNTVVNPHEGFVDVLVDNSNFYFVHSTSDPILIAGLAPGPHRVTLRLVTDDHHPAGAEQTLNFTVAPHPGTVQAPQR